jgi:hypothetical protein
MAYSTNPFSVATFGESYEQADIAVTLTGVVGTGAVGDPDISSRTTVVFAGVQANGAAGSATAAAEAVVVPSAVTATGAAGAITVDGGVGTTPTITMSTAFTASLGGITVSAGFGPTIQPVGFGLQIITDSLLVDGDEVVIDADANISLAGKGVACTISGNTVTLDCKAVVIPTGVQGTFTVGDETVITVQFDYESIKDNYSRDRTAYIGEYSTLGNTAYVRAA